MNVEYPPDHEYPPAYWADLDDDGADDYYPCCICSRLIGDEVALGDSNYFGDGHPICEDCMYGYLPE